MSRNNSAVRQSEGLLFLVSFHEEIANLLDCRRRSAIIDIFPQISGDLLRIKAMVQLNDCNNQIKFRDFAFAFRI